MTWFFVVTVLALPATALAQRVSGGARVHEKGPSGPVTRSNTPARSTPQQPKHTPPPAAASEHGTTSTNNSTSADDRVVYKKRTIIDFTGALIEGDLIKPEGSYVVSRKASRFSSLIRVRENYLPELIASPNDL